MVETFTVRLNHVALNTWLLSQMDNVRECYETDEEWEAHKAECQRERAAVKNKIVEALDINPWAGSVCITQALTDVFTVVYIRKLQ